MLARCFTIRLGLLCAVCIASAACAETDPEIVAIDYLRATREARSDAALAHLDLDELVERISNDVVLVKTEGDPEAFLRESVSSMVWGLFQETPREDLAYHTDSGWRVSGRSLDDIVRYVITRLEERF